MPFPWYGAMLLLMVQRPGPPADPPAAVLRQALLSVESDSVSAVRRRLAGVLERDPSDRAALLVLGSIARLTYDYEQAGTRLSRVVTLRSDDAYADYARMELGASLAARGRFRQADSTYGVALAGAERRGDSTAVGDALLGLAVARSRLASPAVVLPLLDRAERLAKVDPGAVANARCQRAALWSRVGRSEARGLAESGAELAHRAGALRQEARCIQVVAQDFAARGDMAGAAEALGRAAPLFERSRDRASLASLLQWRGYLFNSLGRYGEAQVVLAAAVEEGDRAHAMSPVGWALINLGMISLGMGDRLTATRDLNRAAQLLESQGDRWGVATARGMLGGVARAAGDTAAARQAYTRVLAWADSSGDALTQLNMHSALASLAEMSHDWPLAAREYQAARAIAVTNRMAGWENSLHYNAGRLALRSGDPATAERELRTALASAAAADRSWRYATRALLAEVLVERGDPAGAEAELVAASDEFDAWRFSLSGHDLRVRAMAFDQGLDADLGVATVIAALARSGRVESAFRLAEGRRARELVDRINRAGATRQDTAVVRAAVAERPGADRGDLSGIRRDSTAALLEYVTGRGGEPTTLFVVTRRDMVSYQLAPVDSLEADLRRFTAVLEGDGDARVLGARLGVALLAPALAALGPDVTQLIIVPDDILARLPFDALVLADGRYAVERFAIGLAPSAAAVAALRLRPANATPVRILAFGDPRFASLAPGTTDEDPATQGYRDAFAGVGGLVRLAGSGREARAVGRYAAESVLRLGSGASEAYLRAAPLTAFRVLHFATHAVVDDEAISRTALALAPGDGQDGFLGPGDLAALRLDADLVVLSACRSAGGVMLQGEGVQGMTAPLLQAGARSVVATMWRIADRSAERIVVGLYEGLASGNTVSEALRQSKLSALRGGAKPSEWAAFVTLGDPMTRVPVVRPSGTAFPRGWGVVALAMLLLAAYGLMRKRRGAAAD